MEVLVVVNYHTTKLSECTNEYVLSAKVCLSVCAYLMAGRKGRTGPTMLPTEGRLSEY